MNEESLKLGLKINKGKNMTKVDTTDNVQIDGTETEKVTNYKYLRQTIAIKNRIRQEISIRIKSNMECSWKVQRNLSRLATSHEPKKKGL